MKKKLFQSEVILPTEVVYKQNGEVGIYPVRKCDVPESILMPAGSRRGRLTVDEHGQADFRPYALHPQARYTELIATPHGAVKEGPQSVIVSIRLPKQMSAAQMREAFAEDSYLVDLFFRFLSK